jgi:hypothetical protein
MLFGFAPYEFMGVVQSMLSQAQSVPKAFGLPAVCAQLCLASNRAIILECGFFSDKESDVKKSALISGEKMYHLFFLSALKLLLLFFERKRATRCILTAGEPVSLIRVCLFFN